jgi:hypothetical protein
LQPSDNHWNATVQLPGRELCDLVQTPCRVVAAYAGWPEYLKCNESSHFSRGCSV